MVNPPPDSNESRRQGWPLSFDEFVAVAVAFLSLGTVLFWGLTRGLGQESFFSATGRLLSEPVMDLGEGAGEVDTEDRVAGVAPEALETGPAERFEPERRAALETEEAAQPPVAAVPQTSRTVQVLPPGILPGIPEEEVTAPTGEALAPAETPAPETTSQPEEPQQILDVAQDYWAYPFIKGLSDMDRLGNLPTTGFQPDRPLTRAEMAALLDEALLPGGADGPPQFTDVTADYWASGAIANAEAAGYMSGYPEGDFRPEQPVPRYQVLLTLASGLGLQPVNDPAQTLAQFEDVGNLPGWAYGAIAAAAENGLVINHPNRAQLRPQETATRAEIAAMLYQALVAAAQAEPVESEYIISP